MTLHRPRPRLKILLFFLAIAATTQAQPNREPPLSSTRSSSTPAREASSSRISPGRTSASSHAGKAVLPDPTLLDGSSYEEEKRAEYGMLGEFEMPGSDNREAARVGGSGEESSTSQANGQPPPPSVAVNLPSLPQATPASENKDLSVPQQSGGGAQEGTGENSANSGGGGGGGPQTAAAGASGANAAGDGDGAVGRPREIQMGDATLQIRTLPTTTPGVVGVAAQNQPPSQGERAAGGGGKNSGGSNRGVEKGRTMPSGL